MTPRRFTTTLCAALLGGLLLPTVAGAQPGPPGPPDRQALGDKLMARLRAVRMDVLRNDVGLPAEQAGKAEAILEGFDGDRRKLREAMAVARRDLRQLLTSDSADGAAYAKHVRAMRANHDALHKLRRREFDAVATMLTPKQQAKLVLAMQRVEQRVRHQVRKMREQRGHRGPPPKGPLRGGPGGPPPGVFE